MPLTPPSSSPQTYLPTYDRLFARHNQDTHAHNGRIKWLEDQIINAENVLIKHGIFLDPSVFTYRGQIVDVQPTFDPSVAHGMLVYMDASGVYQPALADGTIKENVVGYADLNLNVVIGGGFITSIYSFTAGDKLYLSATTPGQITNTPTPKQVGIALGGNLILLGLGAGGGGPGEVRFEDLTYAFLLDSNPYNEIYYDIFTQPGTINITSGTVNYKYVDHWYEITAGPAVFETGDVVNLASPQYRFMVHVESDNPPDLVEYSKDGGTTWTSINLDETIIDTGGFTTLRFRFTWNTVPSIFRSYGVLYSYGFNYTDDTRMLEVWNVSTNYPANSIITLPNGATYDVTGKDLEIYVNRARLIPGVDYTEIDERRVQFHIPLSAGDIVIFTQKYGYVDNSIENKQRLDLEHDALGQHVFTDLTTGQRYRLAVDNGNIVLLPV